MEKKVGLECIGIGSLPFSDVDLAMEVVVKYFNIPFWPQLPKLSKNETMSLQFLENMPDKSENFGALKDYAINRSAAFPKFIEVIKKTKPDFAKGQITGPITLSIAIKKDLDVIIKTLAMKALWQIHEIKAANSATIPIIFLDEPSIFRLDRKDLEITKEKAVHILKTISDAIKENGGISGIHCCCKCDWDIPVSAGFDIINPDIYTYFESFCEYTETIKSFLYRGGKIAWGIVPTLNPEALKKADLNSILPIFEKAVKYLTKNGIDEKIIIENSLIASSCGAGNLSGELALKAMKLTRELSDYLKGKKFDI